MGAMRWRDIIFVFLEAVTVVGAIGTAYYCFIFVPIS